MGVLGVILFVLYVIDAVLLALLVLIQDEQGDSLGGIFGGGSNTAFGASSSSVLVKLTRVLGILFLVLSLTVAFFLKTSNKDSIIGESRILNESAAAGDWWEGDAVVPEAEKGSELVIPQN
ncbi:MAG: preprotein translocase subunit SecG [Spirochaetales bacterium]|nr:preprotein translocase subunit SecG [Spirochaetales bacterium]